MDSYNIHKWQINAMRRYDTNTLLKSHSSVTWQRIVNGVLTTVLVDGVRISGGSVNSPSLTITNAVSGDEGNYICTASNIAGTGSSQQTFLDVTGSMYN
jgi:hypothetical protein